MKVRGVLELVKKDRWYLARTRRSHRQFKHDEKPGLVAIPGKPGDDLAPETCNSILVTHSPFARCPLRLSVPLSYPTLARMDDARLLEIADELEADAEGGWASAMIEAEGVELSGSPKGFRTLAALLLRAIASDAALYDRLTDLFGERPAIYALLVSWDAPPGWEPPETKMPLGFWLGLALAAVLLLAVVVLAVVGFLAVIR